jgi:hypothetical protein
VKSLAKAANWGRTTKEDTEDSQLSVSKIVGDFGEHLVAALLAKGGIAVAHAPMEGFDLLALDKEGSVLTKGRLAGISVKTRLLTGNWSSAHTIPTGAAQAEKAARTWSAEPWLAVVCGSLGYSLEVFLLPLSECVKFEGRTTTRDRISVKALRDDKSGVVKKLLSELTFVPPYWLGISDMQKELLEMQSK